MKTSERIYITDFQSLQMEKQRLEIHCDFLEQEIKLKIEDARINYATKFIKPMLPFSDERNNDVFSMMEWLNAKLFGKIFQSAKVKKHREWMIAAIKIGEVLLIRKVAQLFKKKPNTI